MWNEPQKSVDDILQLFLQGYLYVHNMTLDEAPFPPVLPNGDWKIEFRFYGKINGKVVTAFLLTVVAELKNKDARAYFWNIVPCV